MNLVLWFVVGAMMGWASGQFDYQRIGWHIVLGMGGGVVGGAFLAPLIGVAPTPHAFNPEACLMSVFCAIVVLVLAHVLWHRPERRAV